MSLSAIQQAADRIQQARDKAEACGQISAEFGVTSIEDAYQVQEINTERALAAGRRLVGRKIGLTSEVVQQQLGVDQPDFGMLFADMAIENGGEIPSDRLIAPKVEGEIAFVLKRDLTDENLTLLELMSAIDYALPALEVVDSAIADWKITIADTIADNASSALYVLGTTPLKLEDLDLTLEGMVLTKNGQQASIGVGAACLGNPLNACLWLAKTMVKHGRPLMAGDLLLSGALGPMVVVEKGDQIEMELTKLGRVSCKFV